MLDPSDHIIGRNRSDRTHPNKKSSPTGRHKTTPEQFKHTFATNLHDHKWPQSRSKLEELTSEAVGEASFAARAPRIRFPSRAMAHHRCKFCQSETHVFTKWLNFGHRAGFRWPMTSRGVTFVPSDAISSANNTVFRAHEEPHRGSFGPPRGGNQPLLHWTDMSFAWVKQRFVCFWHSKGFSGTSDCDLDRF